MILELIIRTGGRLLAPRYVNQVPSVVLPDVQQFVLVQKYHL
jgi:hypothetical protein